MLNHWTTRIAMATAALTMAVGGVALAQGSSKASNNQKAHHKTIKQSSPAAEPTSATDTDNVQSGDQTTPDAANAAGTSAPSETAGESSNESSSESTAENGPSDGPGGHEDAAGAEVDNQFEGVQ
jgi:hypothetical protein